MKAAIIGCGMISRTYLNSLKQFSVIQVCACCDRNTERVRQTAEEFQLREMTFEEILADQEIELIINLTNPSAHYEINRQSIEAGKHVYSEKMIAVELSEGQELLKLAAEKQVRLGVAPDTFLGGGIQTAGYLVSHGLIGEVTSAVISVNRDYFVTGDILPHLNQRGGGISFDVGCYYLTALLSILGPVEKVTGFAGINRPERVNQRVGTARYGEKMQVTCENILTAALQLTSGVQVSVHITSETIGEDPRLEIYGTEGIVFAGDPNTFDSPVYLKKMYAEKIRFPFTHGFTNQARGIGAAEMIWAMKSNRPHRASMEMAYHVFEVIHGMLISAKEERVYHMKSSFTIPKPLPAGFLENGDWGSVQEAALV